MVNRKLRTSRSWNLLLAGLLLFSLGFNVTLAADPGLDPASVEKLIFPGESVEIIKTVTTPAIPPKLDICLLEDETGSFADDIGNLNAAASGIFDAITAVAPDSQFAVAGFRDYGDAWVYRLLSAMNPAKAAWLGGVGALTAGGGGDTPEAQYDAIVSAASGSPFGPACGWRADPNVTRVLVVTTDAPFHVPPAPWVNTQATTIAALTGQGIRVIGLPAPGAGGELAALAAATGGSTQPLSSNGDNIAAGILAGLQNLSLEVSMTSDCAAPLSTSFTPASQSVTSGQAAQFTETISVAAGAAAGTYTCKDWALLNGEPMTDAAGAIIYEAKTIHVPGIDLQPAEATNELLSGAEHTVIATVTAGDYGPVAGVPVTFDVVSGPRAGASGSGTTDAAGQTSFTYAAPDPVSPADLGDDTIEAAFTNADGSVVYGSDSALKHWVDTTPPTAQCLPTVNPNGNNEPVAPGKGGKGQNQDGFYQALAEDIVWPADSLAIYVTDTGSGATFGPYPVGTRIKYTQAPGATPVAKKMGGDSGSNATAIDYHITGNGDAAITAVDGSGNTGGPAMCLVPPRPQ